MVVPRPRSWLGIALAVLLLMSVSAVSAQEIDFPDDTVPIVKTAGLSNAAIAVALSQATNPTAETIVISRDDEFADALASGVMQSDKPLLLVPSGGPIPPVVRSEIGRLAPTSAIVLGGEVAVQPAVEEELRALGLDVERRAGGSRFDTAIAIARAEAPDADTVILARAFAAPGASDPSQGFADTLAGGGMAAELGWPVLLSESDQLTSVTRDYLLEQDIQQVEILGGTAAISAAVEAELAAMGIVTERLAGAGRAETALAVAQKLGAESAADVARVVLVQGEGADAWAGGFAAAGHAAAFDAPIVLAASDQLPPSTRSFLSEGARFAQSADARLTCVTLPGLCEEARIELGLPPAPVLVPAELRAGYALDGELGASATGAPAMSPIEEPATPPNDFITDPVEGPVLRFAEGNGLRLDWEPGFIPLDSYSFAMRVALDETGGYRRLLDFSERESDRGLYNLSGNLVFFGLSGGDETRITPGTFHTIVLTRNAGGEIHGYVDGVEVLTTIDDGDASLLANDSAILFQDDLQVTDEHSGGRVAWFEVYDGPLTPGQVQALDGP